MCAADASAASSDDYRESVGFSNEMHQCRDSLGSRTCDDAIKKNNNKLMKSGSTGEEEEQMEASAGIMATGSE